MSRTARAASVAELVTIAADLHPRRPAVVDLAGRVATWGDLDDLTAGAAGALRRLDVGPGDRVAVMLPNGVDFAASYWGAMRAGATVVPVNPAYTAPEVAHILEDSEAGLVVAHPALERTVHEAAATMVAVPALIGPEVLREGPRWDGLTGDPTDCAVICYTSGTSGRPKGARLTHANFLSNLEAFSGLPHLRLDEEDVLLGLLPFFHIFGLNVILNAAALHGASVLAMDRFTPAASLAALAAHRVTVSYGAPPVYAAWCAVPPRDVAAPTLLRAAVSGADALPVAVSKAFSDRFGVDILEGYGLTECAPVLTSNAASPSVRPGAVGHPLPGVRLRIAGADLADVAAGEVGEIWARGPNVFEGYHRHPEATAESFFEGWFRTGDLGRVDDDGYLWIAGRLKDLIIVSGFNVYPREVEHALLEHPAVAEAAVVGVADHRTGERVRAVVVPRDGPDVSEDDLMRHCRERLARYKLPREIVLARALPRLATGKVHRSALRDSPPSDSS